MYLIFFMEGLPGLALIVIMKHVSHQMSYIRFMGRECCG